jgi:hypothetical protein
MKVEELKEFKSFTKYTLKTPIPGVLNTFVEFDGNIDILLDTFIKIKRTILFMSCREKNEHRTSKQWCLILSTLFRVRK